MAGPARPIQSGEACDLPVFAATRSGALIPAANNVDTSLRRSLHPSLCAPSGTFRLTCLPSYETLCCRYMCPFDVERTIERRMAIRHHTGHCPASWHTESGQLYPCLTWLHDNTVVLKNQKKYNQSIHFAPVHPLQAQASS